MKHIIAVLLENEPGALSRVVALFSARGYNIESLTVAPTEDASLSRMTIVTTGSDEVIEQITKHLNRLIEVVKVVDLTEGSFVERELMLIKVRAVGKERDEMKRMADIFAAASSMSPKRPTRSSSRATAPSSTPSWSPSTGRRSWKPCAPVPVASGAVSASCASEPAGPPRHASAEHFYGENP
jgi:acetolactate synthase small subunit